MTEVGLELILALSQGMVTGCCDLISDLWRDRWHLNALSLEVRDENLMKVNEVAISLVNDPGV